MGKWVTRGQDARGRPFYRILWTLALWILFRFQTMVTLLMCNLVEKEGKSFRSNGSENDIVVVNLSWLLHGDDQLMMRYVLVRPARLSCVFPVFTQESAPTKRAIPD